MTTTNTFSISDRMKEYENITRNYLIRRMPVIIRLDGKAFHTFTRNMDKPYDVRMNNAMKTVAEFLLNEIQGAEIVYTQSDEISIFLRDYSKFESESWFDNNIQKIVSVAASMASAKFNDKIQDLFGYCTEGDVVAKRQLAYFDARAFNLPKEEVINYMIWRQQDAMRNSVQGLAQEHLSHKAIQGLSNKQVQEEMLKLNPPVDWNTQPDYFKYGQTFFRNGSEMSTPIFKENRDFLNEFIYIKDIK